MYIDSAAIITIASVLGALTAIGAVAYKIIKWFQEAGERGHKGNGR